MTRTIGNTSGRARAPGLVVAVGLAVGLYACGSDSSSESTSATTTVEVPATTAGPPATTVAVATSKGADTNATRALCREIESAGRTVAEGRFVAGGLALSRAVNTYGEKADPTVVGPAKRMLAAGVNGDLDAGAAAVEDAGTACSRLGHPLNIPTGGGGGGGKQCVTTPCN